MGSMGCSVNDDSPCAALRSPVKLPHCIGASPRVTEQNASDDQAHVPRGLERELESASSERSSSKGSKDLDVMSRAIVPPPGPPPPAPRPSRGRLSVAGKASPEMQRIRSPAEKLHHRPASQLSTPARRSRGSSVDTPSTDVITRRTSTSSERPTQKRRRSSKSPAVRRRSSSHSVTRRPSIPGVDEDDRQFVRSLFGLYAEEYQDGSPVMQAEVLQEFLEAFIGKHHNTTFEAAREMALESDELQHESTDCQSTSRTSLKGFEQVFDIIEKTMQPGALKKVIAMRRLACCEDVVLLSKALKSINTSPPRLQSSAAPKTTPWRPC